MRKTLLPVEKNLKSILNDSSTCTLFATAVTLSKDGSTFQIKHAHKCKMNIILLLRVQDLRSLFLIKTNTKASYTNNTYICYSNILS